MLNELLAEGGCTGKQRETVLCLPTMLEEVSRRLQESRTDGDGIRRTAENREVRGQIWTDVSDSRVGRRVSNHRFFKK